MLTATKALKDIQERAETIKRDGLQRFPEAASVGDAARQGDVYFVLLAGVPEHVTEVVPMSQLVPGTTQGSRHILDSLSGVRMFTRSDATELVGPVLLLETERTVTHPEHGDMTLPAGCYGVIYQRNLDAEERQRRVLD